MNLLPTYITQTYTLGGKPIELTIYSYDPQHELEEVKMIADSLTISTTSSGKSITHGLHAGQLHVSLYSESDRVFEALASSNDREVYCTLKRDGKVVWRGMLDGEQWHEPYSYRDGYATDLVFSDFGVLGRTRLSDACGERTVYTIKGFVQKCLDAIYPNNTGQLTVRTTTATYSKIASLIQTDVADYDYLEYCTGESLLSRGFREAVSSLPSDMQSVSTGNICDAIIDLSHWHSDKDRPEDETDVQSVLEDVLKALNLHLWQTTTGDYTLADHETLASDPQYSRLEARGDDATIETTETYNRLTLTIDTDIETDLDKPDMTSIEGSYIRLIDINDKVSDVVATQIKRLGRLSKPISLSDGTDRSNYAYESTGGSISVSDKGVAVACHPFDLLHQKEMTDQTKNMWVAIDSPKDLKDSFIQSAFDTAFAPWNSVKDFTPNPTYAPIWTEEFNLPQIDLSTAGEYFIALSLDLLLDNGYNPYQRDPDLAASRAVTNTFKPNFRKPYDRHKKYIIGVRDLYLEAEITCGDWKLANCYVGKGLYSPQLMTDNDDDYFEFQTYWVSKTNQDFQLYIPYAGVKYGSWCKPVRNYSIQPAGALSFLKKEPRATHNDTLTLPLPPITNAPIRVSVSGRFFHLDGAIVSSAGILPSTNGVISTKKDTIVTERRAMDTFVSKMSNLVSYFLLRNMKLELVRRDEKDEKSEELVLASTLNDKAFEYRKEDLALSTEPVLPSISKSLLRTLEERERNSWLANLWQKASGQKLRPIVTLPPIRGKLTCGAFTGTLEELYIAEQYTHYATRRNRISGSYAPPERITIRHENKQFLITQSDWSVLSDTTQLTMEEIKPIDYSAKYIERTK